MTSIKEFLNKQLNNVSENPVISKLSDFKNHINLLNTKDEFYDTINEINPTIKGKLEYNYNLNKNRMNFTDRLQDSTYSVFGQVLPLAYNNLMNSRHNLFFAKNNKNAFVVNKRTELKSPEINLFMDELGVPKNSRGVVYNNNSKFSQRLASSKRLDDFIEKNKTVLENGSLNKNPVIDFGYDKKHITGYFTDPFALDNFAGVQHATLYKPYIDKQGYFNTLATDYYDFDKRNGYGPSTLANNWGKDMQDKKLLENYFNMYYIHKKVK